MQNFIKYKNNEVFAFHTSQDNQLVNYINSFKNTGNYYCISIICVET